MCEPVLYQATWLGDKTYAGQPVFSVKSGHKNSLNTAKSWLSYIELSKCLDRGKHCSTTRFSTRYLLALQTTERSRPNSHAVKHCFNARAIGFRLHLNFATKQLVPLERTQNSDRQRPSSLSNPKISIANIFFFSLAKYFHTHSPQRATADNPQKSTN